MISAHFREADSD